MGLDIYFYQVLEGNTKCKKEDCKWGGDCTESNLDLNKEDTNKSRIATFEAFKDKAFDVENEYLDIEKYKKDNGYEDYEMVAQSYGEKSIGTLLKREDDGSLDYDNGDTVEINLDYVPLFIENERRLDVCEVGYQRKGMKKNFYSDFIAGCWYVTENTELEEDDSLDIIYKKEDFDRLKTYLDIQDDGRDYRYPMETWGFEEGKHIIYLSS